MSAPRYSAYFDFYFNVVQQGPGPQQVFQTVINTGDTYITNMKKVDDANRRASMGMRRLALDLRLVSSSLRYIVRELGIQETAIGKAVTGVGILVSLTTMIISAQNAWKAIVLALNVEVATFTNVTIAAGAAVKAFILTIWPLLAVIAAVVIAWYGLQTAFNQTTGIARYKKEIKELEEDLEDLGDQMRDVRLEQSALNVSSAALAAEQAALTSQFKQGIITEEEYEKKLVIIEAQQAANRATAADNALQQSYLNYEIAQGTDQQEDYKDAIEGVHEAGRKGVAGMFQGAGQAGGIGFQNIQQRAGRGFQDLMRAIQSFFPGFQQGGMVMRTGPIFAHAGESVIPRGEMAGGINLTISLAGATIYGRDGLEAALEAGGAKVVKQLQYMRRPRVRW